MENKYSRNVKFNLIDYSDPKIVTHRQLYGGVGFNWRDLEITNMSNPTNLKLPSQRFQPADGTSCCEHANATAIELPTGKIVSAQPPYAGVGTVGAGTDIHDLVSWMASHGTCLESISSSNKLEDSALKNAPTPGELYFKGKSPIFINPADADVMEQIAEATAAGHGVLILLGSNETEYDHVNCTPQYLPGTTIEFYHCICAVLAGLINTVKNIVNRDSSGQWSSPNGVRYLTKEFIQAPGHCTGIVYYVDIIDSTPAPVAAPAEETIVTPTATITENSSWSVTTWNNFKMLLSNVGITWFQK